MGSGESCGKVVLGNSNSSLVLDENEEGAELGLGDGDGLEISLVGICVQFNGLTISCWPVGVVDRISISNFSFCSPPSVDSTVVVVPRVGSQSG